MMANVIPIDSARCGATPAEWDHFSLILGLGPDLLPVVSNTKATISPTSTMKDIGKTPSRFNGSGQVVGIADWTKQKSTMADVESWAKVKDYGICIQTRTVRAIDVDITDPAQAAEVKAMLEFMGIVMPCRTRANSSKFLLAFEMPGEFFKRRFKVQHGIVEFLANGQQFIAAGTHASGARIEWAGGLPSEFPVLSAERFEQVWQALVDAFAIEPPAEASAPSKAKKLADAVHQDPTAQHLYREGFVYRENKDGRLDIVCPFDEGHSAQSSDSSTSYWPAHTGGYERGHFHCLHASCLNHSDDEYLRKLGLSEDFEDLTEQFSPPTDASGFDDISGDTAPAPAPKMRFPFVQIADFTNVPPMSYLIKGLFARAGLAVLFGEPGSGKTFAILDMAMAIARGIEWRGRRVKQGRVAFVAAEGSAGLRLRVAAYCKFHEIDPASLPFFVLDASPNMMQKDEALDVAKGILAAGGADIVVMDTFAQVMPGANENAGEDVGKAMAHCKGIHKATGALVLLVHHSGKDASKGARGWSGLKAGADTEIEISREGDVRKIRVSKQKDGLDGIELGFRLVTVPLGIDEDGDVIDSCVVEEAEIPAAGARVRSLGKVEKVVVEVVGEIAEFQSAGIEIKAVIDEVAKRLPAPDGKRDTRKQHARRALLSLCEGDDAPYFLENDCLEIL